MNEEHRDPDTIQEINKLTGALVGGVMGLVLSIFICGFDYRIPEWLYLVGLGSGMGFGWRVGSKPVYGQSDNSDTNNR